MDLSSLNGSTGFRLDGVAANDTAGRAVSAAGDINGDGIDDLVIGAPAADPNGSASGSSYIVFGTSGVFPASMDLSSLNGSTGFRLDGVATGDQSGTAVSAAGDINGDGIDDLLIGAFGASLNGSSSGSSYIVFGSSGGFLPSMNLSSLNGSTGFRLDGVAANDQSGRAVSGAGDINGDGIDDLLIGAWGAEPNAPLSGSSYIVFGASGGFPASMNLSSLNGSTGFRLDGEALGDRSGSAVSAAGDISGDGIDDLLIGAWAASPNGTNSGSSYIVFGTSGGFPANMELSSLDGSTGFRLDGEALGDQSGSAVSAAGDINGDGIDDLVIGAPLADPNGNSSGSSYIVFGRLTAPVLGLAPDNLSFGNVPLGISSTPQSVTISNTGGADLVLAALNISGSNFGDFTLSNDLCSNQTILPAATCSFDISLTPTATGARAAQVDVPSNAASSPDTVALSGTGTAAGLSLSSSNIAFGNVPLGNSSTPQSVTISNTGDADLVLAALNISGSNFGDFALSNDLCSNQTILPAATCSFDISLTPTATGARAAQVDVPSNTASSPDTVALSGTGTVAGVGLSSSNIAFGNVALGTSSTPQSVTISNTGDADLLISSISTPDAPFLLISSTSTPDVPFALSGSSCAATPFSLLPNASCDLTIEFAPTTAGDFSASIVIQSNAPDSPDEILLAGTGQVLIAKAIPTLDRIGLILLSGLLGWLGIKRRFAHSSRE